MCVITFGHNIIIIFHYLVSGATGGGLEGRTQDKIFQGLMDALGQSYPLDFYMAEGLLHVA